MNLLCSTSRTTGFLLVALFVPALAAQPSGGPYGPLQQRYELPTAGTIYFVAPDGRGDASGENLDATTTLDEAITRVVTGDTIVLRGGVYRTGSLRLSQGVTLQPYESEHPVIKGTEIATDWTAAGEGRWKTSWLSLFPAEPADWWRRERNVRHTPLHLFNDDMVFIDGELLGAVGTREDVGETTYFIDYPNAEVFIGQDPTDKLVEITAHNSALVRTTRVAHGKPNDGRGATLRGLTFTQYARLALLVEGTEPGAFVSPDTFGKEIIGTTFEHLTISHCSRVAGYFRGDGLIMRHCLVADTGTEGIYVINSADVLLERNIVTRTNSSENLGGYYASAVKIFNQSYNVVVRDNLIIDNPNASGVWYDVGNVDGVFVNNWVQNTPNGFFFEISKGAICAGNVFVNCGPGVRILNSSGVRVYQNTFYNSQSAFQRSDRSHQTGDHFGWHASAGPDVEERHSHEFVNNLIAVGDTFTGPLASFWQHENVNGRVTVPHVSKMDGNVYVRRSGAVEQPLIYWAPTEAPVFNRDYADVAEFHADLPSFEGEGRSFADYWGPLFRGSEIGNFELLSAFPGARIGATLPGDIRELLARESDAGSYPGAYAPLD